MEPTNFTWLKANMVTNLLEVVLGVGLLDHKVPEVRFLCV
jgi:hypothetical protein